MTSFTHTLSDEFNPLATECITTAAALGKSIGGANSTSKRDSTRKATRDRPNSRMACYIILLSLFLGTGCSSITSSGGTIPTWTKAVQVTTPANNSNAISMYGVSCPSSSFCVSVDASGSAHFWKGGKWSKPQSLGVGGSLTSVSCPTIQFCAATSAGGSATIYNGHSWSPATSIGTPGTYEVSCATATFCAAIGISGSLSVPTTVETFDGHSWTTIQSSSTGTLDDRLMDVSCSTPTQCLAVNLNGHVLSFNGTKWSTTQNAIVKGLISISCPNSSFCLAVTASGEYVTFDGQFWSTPKVIPGLQAGFARSVSCSSTRECSVVSLSGLATTWQQSHWSTPATIFHRDLASVAISCATSNQCMAVNNLGQASYS